MNKCQSCGKENVPEAAHCQYCGIKLEQTSTNQQAKAGGIELGFMDTLFDFNFKSLATSKIVKLLYIVSVIFGGLVGFGFLVISFINSPINGIIALIIVPVGFFFHVIVSRVALEMVIVVFRIAEDIQIVADKSRE